MKMIYVKPSAEVVNVKLSGSVMGGEGTPVINSPVADPSDSFAKEIDFDNFNSEEDIWAGRQMKDVWER